MARQAGFRAALADATGERDPIVVPGDYSEASGADAARLLIAARTRIDAIFCANDMMAVGCAGVLKQAGIAIGDGIGIAGFDDIPIAHYADPGFTTMNVSIAEMGATATDKLIALMSGGTLAEEMTILAPQLVVRESTARAGARPKPSNSNIRTVEEGTLA
jgi:LacI family transcriptional regulator